MATERTLESGDRDRVTRGSDHLNQDRDGRHAVGQTGSPRRSIGYESLKAVPCRLKARLMGSRNRRAGAVLARE